MQRGHQPAAAGWQLGRPRVVEAHGQRAAAHPVRVAGDRVDGRGGHLVGRRERQLEVGNPGEGHHPRQRGAGIGREVLVAQPEIAVGAAPQPPRGTVPQVPLQRALGRREPQHLRPLASVGKGLRPAPRIGHAARIAHDVHDAEVDALQLLQHVAERRRLRGVDDQLRAGDVLDAAVDRGQGIGQGVQTRRQPITRPPGRQHQRQLARAHDAGVLRDQRGGIDRHRVAERLLDHRPPDGAGTHGLAAPADPAFQQTPLPQEPDLAGGEDTGRRAEDRVDERGPAAAEAGDEQHTRSVVGRRLAGTGRTRRHRRVRRRTRGMIDRRDLTWR